MTAASDLKILQVAGVEDLEKIPEVDGPIIMNRDGYMGVDLGDVATKEKVFIIRMSQETETNRMLKQHLTTISYILGELFASTMANTVDCCRFGSCLQSLNCLDLNWIN